MEAAHHLWQVTVAQPPPRQVAVAQPLPRQVAVVQTPPRQVAVAQPPPVCCRWVCTVRKTPCCLRLRLPLGLG